MKYFCSCILKGFYRRSWGIWREGKIIFQNIYLLWFYLHSKLSVLCWTKYSIRICFVLAILTTKSHLQVTHICQSMCTMLNKQATCFQWMVLDRMSANGDMRSRSWVLTVIWASVPQQCTSSLQTCTHFLNQCKVMTCWCRHSKIISRVNAKTSFCWIMYSSTIVE